MPLIPQLGDQFNYKDGQIFGHDCVLITPREMGVDWNDENKHYRSVVIRKSDGRVISRGFSKFVNWGETPTFEPWNPEWQAIREMLIEAAKKNENKFGALKFGLEYEDIVDGMWVVYTELPLSNYANSLKQINKIENGWRELTISVEWEGKYVVSINEHSFNRSIWDEKCYAPVGYNGEDDPVEFMNKILPLTIKGIQDT